MFLTEIQSQTNVFDPKSMCLLGPITGGRIKRNCHYSLDTLMNYGIFLGWGLVK